MTEPTNTNATYATQILMDYVAYIISNDLYDNSPPDLEALKENPYMFLFMNRLDALYTSDFILTEDLLESISIRFNMDQEEWDSDEYNEYIGYEEYICDFVINGNHRENTDIYNVASVYKFNLNLNEAAPAA
jgi:hypothetical protein